MPGPHFLCYCSQTVRDKNSDLIFVMKNGDIIESDRHDKLLAKGGFYAELYNSQFDDAA